jgi:DNA polymerase-3 subunit epsilon
MNREYAITDIETTGLGGTKGNRITEIAIAIHDGEKVIKEYHSLVNPETPISNYVIGLTGIDNTMVLKAPTFSEIASEVMTLTENRIFVAHNVNFDYHILKKEFERIGFIFTRKRLCTVRLSKQLYPGFRSYSLGNLCKQLAIPINNRHRARGDTEATTILFEKLIAKDTEKVVSKHIKANSGEATLPPLLPKETYMQLPEVQGVYYFKDIKGTIIYVGKAKNIKKRVLGHFYHKSSKEIALCKETAQIDYENTGNELVALLLESSAIKKYSPKYNRAQKKITTRYAITSYLNRKDILQLAYGNAKNLKNSFFICYSITEAIAMLEMLCDIFHLCPKYTQLQQNVPHCSHFKIKNCKGICKDEEAIAIYNKRVEKAIDFIKKTSTNFVIYEKGRVPDETAFVLIQNNIYQGFGYFPKNSIIDSAADLYPWLKQQKDNLDVKRILAQYIRKTPQNLNTDIFDTEKKYISQSKAL